MTCVLCDDKKRPFDNSHLREQPNNTDSMHEHHIAHNEKNQPSSGPNAYFLKYVFESKHLCEWSCQQQTD